MKNKVIKIEHLAYRIIIKKITIKNNPNNFQMFVRKINGYSCELYTKNKFKITDTPTLAHEVTHILQYIAEARNINMIYEQEHMGYLMQYIMCQLLDLEYNY